MFPPGPESLRKNLQRLSKHISIKHVFTCLTVSIPCEAFLPLLSTGYSKERKSNADRKKIYLLILFKILVFY
jgi:hypothetical protein